MPGTLSLLFLLLVLLLLLTFPRIQQNPSHRDLRPSLCPTARLRTFRLAPLPTERCLPPLSRDLRSPWDTWLPPSPAPRPPFPTRFLQLPDIRRLPLPTLRRGIPNPPREAFPGLHPGPRRSPCPILLPIPLLPLPDRGTLPTSRLEQGDRSVPTPLSPLSRISRSQHRLPILGLPQPLDTPHLQTLSILPGLDTNPGLPGSILC